MLSFKKFLVILPTILLTAPILSSCNNGNNPSDGIIYLKVLNSEDYIYKYDEDEAKKEGGNKNPDMTVQFEQHMKKKFNKNVRVIYDTFDTMENMYNTLKTGKTSYDLICASEYMIQKLAREVVNGKSLIQKLDKSKILNYFGDYKFYLDEGPSSCSPYIREKLSNIPAVAGKEISEVGSLDDYAVCYMWGTLGILYNPEFKMLKDRGLTNEEIHNDMNDWATLWNSKYKKSIAIKDSMRDTYCIGVMHSFKDELNKYEDFENRNRVFNYGGEADNNAKEHIKTVENDLLNLRKNVFGFEVDSGKQDIVTGKIGVDTAWSGDAVYSMNQGDEEKSARLYYSIPEEGTNLWFDCWAMQSSCTGENKEVALEFLNFISDPENAIQNMDYIGYTSPIAGEATFDYFDETYSEEEESEDTETYDVSYFFNEKDETQSGVHTFNVLKSEINRQIAAQFPREQLKDKLMVMQDYGNNNDLILTMWEHVKHESLPGWAIALLSVEAGIAAIGIAIFVVIKVKDKNRRKNRRNKLSIAK